MTPGTEISYAGKGASMGLSIYRVTDGGGWQTDGNSTPGTCNGACAPPSNLLVEINGYANETCLQSNGWALAEISGGSGLYDIDWNNPPSSADSLTGLPAGFYSVTVTDSSGCKTSASVTLVNIGIPVSVAIVPPDVTIFRGESYQLALNTTAILDSVSWTPVSGLSCTNCSSPNASPVTLTTYTVNVIDTDGCTGSASTVIHVISDENSVFIPTAFTPNNDNLNDLLFVRSSKLVSLEFHIYDRWGNEVFYTTDPNVGWNGLDKNGREVDAGIYIYYAVVNFDNGKLKTIKGNVGVLR